MGKLKYTLTDYTTLKGLRIGTYRFVTFSVGEALQGTCGEEPAIIVSLPPKIQESGYIIWVVISKDSIC